VERERTIRAVPHSSPGERITVELSICEAMTVAAALRQYEPYWSVTDSAAVVADQLAHVREDITAVIAKLRSAAATVP
jgi:hypothetical protein